MWLLPWEKLPPILTGPLMMIIGIAGLVPSLRERDARSAVLASAILAFGIGTAVFGLRLVRCRAAWRAVVQQLRGYDPLLQWSTNHPERFTGWLGDAGFTDAGPRDGVQFSDVDAVVVLGDCTLLDRRFHCDLASLAASLRLLRDVDVRPAAPDGMLPTLAAVPALRVRVRVRPWPRWLERVELTDEEKTIIEKRRLP